MNLLQLISSDFGHCFIYIHIQFLLHVESLSHLPKKRSFLNILASYLH
nr:MAG TPA: hypothetical protein [Caudoviricetes sp.]